MRRVMKMIAGGGLSITGSHTMCGDYLYSGHTVMLTLTYLFIKECKFHLQIQVKGQYMLNFTTDAHTTTSSPICISLIEFGLYNAFLKRVRKCSWKGDVEEMCYSLANVLTRCFQFVKILLHKKFHVPLYHDVIYLAQITTKHKGQQLQYFNCLFKWGTYIRLNSPS